MNEHTQWICKTEPRCECTEDDTEFTCDCAVVLSEKRCSNCGAAMIEIETDSGAEVAA